MTRVRSSTRVSSATTSELRAYPSRVAMGMIVDRLNSQRGAIASSDERATTVMRFRLIKATRRLTIQLMRKKRHEMPRQASLVKRRAENRHARWERSCCNRGAARSAKQLLTLSLSLSLSLFLSPAGRQRYNVYLRRGSNNGTENGDEQSPFRCIIVHHPPR